MSQSTSSTKKVVPVHLVVVQVTTNSPPPQDYSQTPSPNSHYSAKATNTVLSSISINPMNAGVSTTRLMQTIYKVHYSRQIENARNENVSRERAIARGPNGTSLLLHTKHQFRSKVAYVTETLTRVGPAISPAKFMGLVQKLRLQKVILTPITAGPRASASGAIVAPAHAAPRRSSPILCSRSEAPSPFAVADADGDIEMTEANTGEVVTLTDDTLPRIIDALAQVAPGVHIHFSEPSESHRVAQNCAQPPPVVSVEMTDAAGPVPVTRESLRQIAKVVHRIAPGVSVTVLQRRRVVQNAEQPPPYTAADEARPHLIARRG